MRLNRARFLHPRTCLSSRLATRGVTASSTLAEARRGCSPLLAEPRRFASAATATTTMRRLAADAAARGRAQAPRWQRHIQLPAIAVLLERLHALTYFARLVVRLASNSLVGTVQRTRSRRLRGRTQHRPLRSRLPLHPLPSGSGRARVRRAWRTCWRNGASNARLRAPILKPRYKRGWPRYVPKLRRRHRRSPRRQVRLPPLLRRRWHLQVVIREAQRHSMWLTVFLLAKHRRFRPTRTRTAPIKIAAT